MTRRALDALAIVIIFGFTVWLACARLNQRIRAPWRLTEMNKIMTNWKTTAGGGLTMLIGIASLFGVQIGQTPVDANSAVAMITAGYGLLMAKDFNVTGGDTRQ